MYVDYSYYKDTYGGNLSSDVFKQKEIQASAVVDFYTFNRIKTADDKVKMCVCDLVDFLYFQEKLETEGPKAVKSESVSKYKVEYADATNGASTMTKEEKQREIVRKWLLHTRLMYRGVSKC